MAARQAGQPLAPANLQQRQPPSPGLQPVGTNSLSIPLSTPSSPQFRPSRGEKSLPQPPLSEREGSSGAGDRARRSGRGTNDVEPPQLDPPRNMRCRSQSEVPKCFRYVRCPFPLAQVADGTYGAINYSLAGPEDGEVVVCFHGLNGSRLLFLDLANFLSGFFRVLCFDFYGHGLSNAPRVDLCPRSGCARHCTCGPPRGRYDLDFFVEQSAELLELVGLGDVPVNLVGFSMGGSVAVAFAQRYPHRVKRLVPMSPSGFIPKVPVSYYLLRATWCWLIPLAPHFLCTCWYNKERFTRSLSHDGQQVDEEAIENLWGRFVWQLYVKRGVVSATLATLHRIPWFNLKKVFQDAGRHDRPVLLIWGEQDALNPPQTVAEEIKQCFSNVKLLVVKGAGHIAICERPRQVILSIAEFLHLPTETRMSQVQLTAATHRITRQGHSTARTSPRTAAARGQRAARLKGDSTGAAEPQLPAATNTRMVDRASQMPIPMVLGHAEDAPPSGQP